MKDWLVDSSLQHPTTMAYGPTYKPLRVKSIEMLVLHYTAVSAATARSILTKYEPVPCGECAATGKIDGRRCRMCDGDGIIDPAYRSAHFLVRRDGEIEQYAPLSNRTFHAGGRTSRWRGRGGVNNRSIGIELENYGPLDLKGGHLYTWVGHQIYADSDIQVEQDADGNWWEKYADEQMTSVEWLLMELFHEFPHVTVTDTPGPLAGIDVVGTPDARILGHEHVDPTRKRDPGPLFPWGRVTSVRDSFGE